MLEGLQDLIGLFPLKLYLLKVLRIQERKGWFKDGGNSLCLERQDSDFFWFLADDPTLNNLQVQRRPKDGTQKWLPVYLLYKATMSK